MRNRTIFSAFLALAVLLLVTATCGVSISTANIKSATLAKGYENDQAVEPTNVFAPTDQTIHLAVKVANAPSDTSVKAIWYVAEVEGYEPSVIDETSITLDTFQDSIDFDLTSDQPWPVGKYKVELYLDGKLDQTLEYEVR
jgi:hypothetical protein